MATDTIKRTAAAHSDEIDKILGAAPGATPRHTGGSTLASRSKSKRKPPLSRYDGRYLRSTGRAAQVSCKIQPALFDAVGEVCEAIGATKVAFYEVAIQHLVDQINDGKVSFDDLVKEQQGQ